MATISGEKMAYQRVRALFEAGQREFIGNYTRDSYRVCALQADTCQVTVARIRDGYEFCASAAQFLIEFEPAPAQPKEPSVQPLGETRFSIGDRVRVWRLCRCAEFTNEFAANRNVLLNCCGTVVCIGSGSRLLKVQAIVNGVSACAWFYPEELELVSSEVTNGESELILLPSEAEVDSLIGTKIAPAERDAFIELKLSNPELFKKFLDQRKDLHFQELPQRAEVAYQTPMCDAKFLDSAAVCCDNPLGHSDDHRQTFSDGSYIGWANPYELPVAAVLLRKSDSRLPVALQYAIEWLDADCGALSLGAAKQLQEHLAQLRDTLRAAIDLVRQRRVTAKGYGRIKDCCLTVLGSCCAAYTGGRYSEVEELAIVNAFAVTVDQAAATLKNSLFKLPEDDSLERRLEATPFGKPEIQLTVDREQDPDEPLLRYRACPTCDYRWAERPSTRVSSCSKCGWSIAQEEELAAELAAELETALLGDLAS
jgi:hypothetical protein